MKTGKGRAPAVDPIEARQLFLNAIAAAPAPLSAKDLGTLPELGRKVPGMSVSKWLADDLQSGDVYWWGSGKTRGLWNRDPEDAAHDRILELAAAELLGRTALEKRAAGMAPAIGGAVVKLARAALLAEGRLREVPAPAGVKGKIVINAVRREPYLQASIARLLDSFLEIHGRRPLPGPGQLCRDIRLRRFVNGVPAHNAVLLRTVRIAGNRGAQINEERAAVSGKTARFAYS